LLGEAATYPEGEASGIQDFPDCRFCMDIQRQLRRNKLACRAKEAAARQADLPGRNGRMYVPWS
jgi:hypothetical protein